MDKRLHVEICARVWHPSLRYHACSSRVYTRCMMDNFILLASFEQRAATVLRTWSVSRIWRRQRLRDNSDCSLYFLPAWCAFCCLALGPIRKDTLWTPRWSLGYLLLFGSTCIREIGQREETDIYIQVYMEDKKSFPPGFLCDCNSSSWSSLAHSN